MELIPSIGPSLFVCCSVIPIHGTSSECFMYLAFSFNYCIQCCLRRRCCPWSINFFVCHGVVLKFNITTDTLNDFRWCSIDVHASWSSQPNNSEWPRSSPPDQKSETTKKMHRCVKNEKMAYNFSEWNGAILQIVHSRNCLIDSFTCCWKLGFCNQEHLVSDQFVQFCTTSSFQ